MIKTSVMSETKPELISKDSRGTEIKEGLRIAYNRAGAITVGHILSFSTRWRPSRPGTGRSKWWKNYFEMLIQPEDGSDISKVKNPNSFIII